MGETKNYFSQPKVCANFVYDLNGSKGPNTVGKDIGFITVLYPTDSSVVAPLPYYGLVDATSANASSVCTHSVGEEYRLPTMDELASLFVNVNLLYEATWNTAWFSSSKRTPRQNWVISPMLGEYRIPASGDQVLQSFCVKR